MTNEEKQESFKKKDEMSVQTKIEKIPKKRIFIPKKR